MVLSMGVIRAGTDWKTCMVEQGRPVEQCAFEDAPSILSYLERTCAQYPELTLAVSPGGETPFLSLSDLLPSQWKSLLTFPFNDWSIQQASEFLIAIKNINLHSYLMPSPRYLPGIPLYRKLGSSNLGTSNDVCAVVALLCRLREKEAAWQEMQLLFVQVNRRAKSIQIVEDGCIVSSMSREIDTRERNEQLNVEYERALWEGLKLDIGGLMAVHHCEDIVALGDYQEAFIDRFAEEYQVYLFPSDESDRPGFEPALGAAIVAEGLYLPGKASEIVERLHIREASR